MRLLTARSWVRPPTEEFFCLFLWLCVLWVYQRAPTLLSSLLSTPPNLHSSLLSTHHYSPLITTLHSSLLSTPPTLHLSLLSTHHTLYASLLSTHHYSPLLLLSTYHYYLRSVGHYQSLAYPPRLAVDLGSYVDGEAHGWARQPYGYFDPAPRPRDIIHTYSYGRRPRLAHPTRG